MQNNIPLFDPTFDPDAPFEPSVSIRSLRPVYQSEATRLPATRDISDDDAVPRPDPAPFKTVERGEPIPKHPNYTIVGRGVKTDKLRNKTPTFVIRCNRCGHDRVVNATRLYNPKPLHCNYCTYEFKKLAVKGAKFGQLTVEQPEDENGYITFRCDCGRTYRTRNIDRFVMSRELRCPHCAKRDAKLNNVRNVKFDFLTAVKYLRSENNNAVWLFRCDCGKFVEYPLNIVKAGVVRSCGCAENGITGRTPIAPTREVKRSDK